MLLTIDVGNTQTHLGTFQGQSLFQHWRFATHGDDTADELATRIAALLKLHGLDLDSISATAISSVVPRLSTEYERMVPQYLGHECLMVAPGVKTGMPVRLDNPHELGADRLVNAIAAYDKVQGACAVVDFGTAITVDAVSANGEYLGGVIAPGIQISMEALAERAARLPKVDFAEPERVIGRTTQASLQSGMVYGFAGAIDSIAGRVAAELDPGARFIATGGMASSIVPYCTKIDEVDELLTLTGLQLIHSRNAAAAAAAGAAAHV